MRRVEVFAPPERRTGPGRRAPRALVGGLRLLRKVTLHGGVLFKPFLLPHFFIEEPLRSIRAYVRVQLRRVSCVLPPWLNPCRHRLLVSPKNVTLVANPCRTARDGIGSLWVPLTVLQLC